MDMRKQQAIEVTYDPEADAISIRFGRSEGHVVTRELDKNHYADFDEKGRLLAIEILFASRYHDAEALERLPVPSDPLTLAEAAEESGLSPTTLRNQIRNGRLAATKRGRDWVVEGRDLINYLESREHRGRRPAVEKATRRRRTVAA